ncbi:alpha-tocopherol transfer protein-like [Vanessa cardui]|uniref:alpha-tocopherol transfer protein-like n=1 Tax=Vanessa cardui TaxID=171605 RepID=UPI001F1369EE|nr:alpha-tocopherol transfer protein-like [Vanessa cardui]
MDTIPKDRILESKSDALTAIRKQYNLDKPGQMKEAVSILRDWVQQQEHFKKKDFSLHYYENCIITCKGSLERAKSQLDKICTMRTLLPQFFGDYNVKSDFESLNEIVYVFPLPKLTDDYYRVIIIKNYDITVLKNSHLMDYYKEVIILAEYLKAHDYVTGFIAILDYSETNIMDIVSKLNPVELKQAMSILIQGYGMRIKGIFIISTSKVVNSMVAILKQVLSAKVADRINVLKDVEDIHNYIPQEILPKDYGGEERCSKDLRNEWLDALSSEEHMKYMREMNAAGTDETFRRKDSFNEQYAGMPGTFKVLSVD